MRHEGGFGPKEVLLAVFVLVLAATLLFPAFKRVEDRNLLLSESGRMRQVYIALSEYEEENDNLPTPSLLPAARFDPRQTDFLSNVDPFAKTASSDGRFPVDASLDDGEYAPFRISYSYLIDFVRNGRLQMEPWLQVRLDPRIGELADEWYGDVRPDEPFRAEVGGRLLRINTDGSVYVLKDRGGLKPLGNGQDLFIRRR